MSTYQSIFTGTQIDQALARAQTALQPGDGGVQRYATVSDLPMSGVSQGTLALVDTTLQGDSAVFLWNGNETAGGWYKLATVNLAPSIVAGPDAAYELPIDGTPLVLTLAAQDPEGLPVSWSYSVAAGNPAGIATVTEGPEGVFTVAADPAAIVSQTGGTFSLTFTASDGVSLAGATSEFTLNFGLRSRLLVTGTSSDPRISTYDLQSDLSLTPYSALSSSSVTGIAFVTNDLAIVSNASSTANPRFVRSVDGVLSLITDAFTGAGSQASSAIGTVGASPDGRWCAVSCSASPYVAFYEIVAGSPVKRAHTGGPTSTGWSVAFHPDNQFAVVSDSTSAISVFDLSSGSPVGVRYTGLGLVGDASFLTFSADGLHLYFLDTLASPRVRVMDFDPSTGTLSNNRAVANAPSTGTAVTLSSDGVYLGVAAAPPVILDVSAGPDSAAVFDTGVVFPAATGRLVPFSQDGRWAAVTYSTAPFLTVYSIEASGAWTEVSLPAPVPAFLATATFSPA